MANLAIGHKPPLRNSRLKGTIFTISIPTFPLMISHQRLKDYEHNDFRPEAGNAVAWGIIAKAFEYGLDPTDEKQRRMATAYLLERVSWTGMSEFKAGLTTARTRQLCDVMTVPKDLMKNLILAAGGKGSISVGGGGSSNELTNWDGTKKRNGWGVS